MLSAADMDILASMGEGERVPVDAKALLAWQEHIHALERRVESLQAALVHNQDLCLRYREGDAAALRGEKEVKSLHDAVDFLGAEVAAGKRTIADLQVENRALIGELQTVMQALKDATDSIPGQALALSVAPRSMPPSALMRLTEEVGSLPSSQDSFATAEPIDSRSPVPGG